METSLLMVKSRCFAKENNQSSDRETQLLDPEEKKNNNMVEKSRQNIILSPKKLQIHLRKKARTGIEALKNETLQIKLKSPGYLLIISFPNPKENIILNLRLIQVIILLTMKRQLLRSTCHVMGSVLTVATYELI